MAEAWPPGVVNAVFHLLLCLRVDVILFLAAL